MVKPADTAACRPSRGPSRLELRGIRFLKDADGGPPQSCRAVPSRDVSNISVFRRRALLGSAKRNAPNRRRGRSGRQTCWTTDGESGDARHGPAGEDAGRTAIHRARCVAANSAMCKCKLFFG